MSGSKSPGDPPEQPCVRSFRWSGLRREARHLTLSFGAFFFPTACLVCGVPRPAQRPWPLCPACRRRLVPVLGPTCLLCRRDERGVRGFAAGRDCRDPAHAGFRAWAAVQMVDPADHLVHALKFKDRPDVAPIMARLIHRRLRRERAGPFDGVLPLPLHPVRERSRGYNQSAELGRPLALRLRSSFLSPGLERRRATRPQADLDYTERATNVSGAFRLTDGVDLRGRRLLLVDDVATTGHTLVAALTTLERAGATGVAAVFALA